MGTLVRNLNLRDAVIMSAALMGPAVSVYFNPQYAVGFAGPAMPFVFLVSMAAAIIVANSVGQFTKKLPSAGAFYTFTSQSLSPQFGFITGWLMFIGYTLLEPAELALIGSWTSQVLAQNFSIHISWLIPSLVFWALVLYLAWIGARQSLKTSMYLFSGEVAVILILCLIILAKGGADGIHFSVFNPGLSPKGMGGIALGMVYGILSFVGFEAAATLGEEVTDPKRNIYKGIMGSVLLVGFVYLFATFTEMQGFGIAHWQALAANGAPFNTLAIRYVGGPFVLLVDLAGISSILAVTINVHAGITRIVYAMGRERVLPSAFGNVHPKYRTPMAANLLQSGISLVLFLVIGIAAGPQNAYGYLGALLTLGIIPVYILVSVGLVRFARSQAEWKNRIGSFVILPILGALVMVVPLFGSVYPIPPAPYNYFPYIVLAWILIGLVIILAIGRRDPQRLVQMGQALSDVEVAGS